jgi:hypothetical protein
LRWLYYDEGIDSAEVYLLDGPGEAELMSRNEALTIARGRGRELRPLYVSADPVSRTAYQPEIDHGLGDTIVDALLDRLDDSASGG